jgi:hypothetical protein
VLSVLAELVLDAHLLGREPEWEVADVMFDEKRSGFRAQELRAEIAEGR